MSATAIANRQLPATTVPLTATFAMALGTPATTGVNKTNELVVPKAGTITKITARAKTGPTGSDLIFDVRKNGVTIWSTVSNRLKIAANTVNGSQTLFDTPVLAEGDVLSLDIVQVGLGIPGQDLTVTILIACPN